MFEHIEGQPIDAAIFLDDRDEAVGRDEAALGVRPADQRLGAGDGTGPQFDLGLVGDPQVLIVDRAIDLAEQRQTPIILLVARDEACPAYALLDCLVGAAVSCGGFFTVEELGEGNCELSQPPPSASINCTLEFMACSRRSTAVC